MLLSVVSVLVVAQSSSEISEGLMNNPVYSRQRVNSPEECEILTLLHKGRCATVQAELIACSLRRKGFTPRIMQAKFLAGRVTRGQSFSPNTSVVSCRYHSTFAPYSLITLSPTLNTVSNWQRRYIADTDTIQSANSATKCTVV